MKSTDAKNCVGYEGRTSGGGGRAIAFGMRPGFSCLPFFKTGGNACPVPVLPCQCVGDGGIRQGIWKLSERLRLCNAVKKLGWVCKVLLLVDENADELLAADVRQAVKDQLVDNFIYASVSPTYLAGVIDTL